MHNFGSILVVLLATSSAWASVDQAADSLMHLISTLIIQLGCIVVAARIGGGIFEKLRLPAVVGELVAGMAIGPYSLGKIPLPGMPFGLFGQQTAEAFFPVSIQLYSFATFASIILLFMAGLETDISLFLQFSFVSSIVGGGGVIASFLLGALAGIWVLGLPVNDPQTMFLGIMSTATSVGITARILSEKRKTDSPEGVTILGAAVIDDVLGILLLTVVLGITGVGTREVAASSHMASMILGIVIKAFLVFVICGAILLLFANKIAWLLKRLKTPLQGAVMSLAFALLLAGVFEKVGLAMIIGAYLMGLALSKTDLALVFGEMMRPVYSFFVPIFFVVLGMLVNIEDIISLRIIRFGLIYTALAVMAKLAGCGVAAIPFKFNMLGALRIGLGMVPRGEVALIIAGIGLSSGVFDHDIFSGAVLMTLLTTLVAPPLLSLTLVSKKKGTLRELKERERVSISFDFGSPDITLLVETKVLQYLRAEGFFVIEAGREKEVWYARKGNSFFTLRVEKGRFTMESDTEHVGLAKTIVYEALIDFQTVIGKARKAIRPEALRGDVATGIEDRDFDARGIFDPSCIILSMKSRTKEEALRELVDVLYRTNKISDRSSALQCILERERSMSTGMQNGIAIPHGRCGTVSKTVAAVGFSREGIDFLSLDGKPARLIILIVYPQDISGPYVSFLAGLAGLLNQETYRERLLAAKSAAEVYRLLTVPQL